MTRTLAYFQNFMDPVALDILADTAEIGELDALTIENNAKREAWGFEIEGMNASNQATLYDYEAANQNPLTAQAGTLFSGIGSVADKWAWHKKNSVGGIS